MSTHYDTLGVAPTATTKEIRKAYLRRARALHPDRQQGRSPADARRAEEAMRQVNVAWNVLSNGEKRSEYDVSISPRNSSQRSANSTRSGQSSNPSAQQRPSSQPNSARVRTTGGGGQSRPKEQQRRSIDDEPGDGSVSVLASLPVLIIVGIALGLLIVTAFGNQDDVDDNRERAPALDSQIRDSDCFIFLTNGGIQQESCSSGRADALAIDVVPDPGNCPAGTESIAQGEIVLCFERLVAGSSVPAG